MLLPLACFANDEATAQLEKANALYTKSQYPEALTIYKKIIKEGYQSAALYFNTGNAFYKTGDIPSAILYYEKARKLAPGDEDILFNIRFANLKTTDKIDEAPVFFLTNWWNTIVLSLPVNALATISILCFLIASGSLIFYFFSEAVSAKKVGFYMAIILFSLGISSVFLSGSQVSYFNNHRQAIIFSSSSEIKSAPAAQAKTVFVLHEGTKVNVMETENGWVRITLGNGNEGWIKKTDERDI
jgi:tetratricopeptide (TPR) repeat protein